MVCFNVFTGRALESYTIFAMGIFPYINASIIMQLLTVVIPKFEEWAKEGTEGQKNAADCSLRCCPLALLQATGMTLGLFRSAVLNPGAFTYFTIIVTLTAGTAFLMWLGEIITEKGIGNGISIIIFAGIVSGFGPGVLQTYELTKVGTINILAVLATIIITLALIVGIIALEEGQRRIPVQYAKRVVGRKMYGGQSTHIPLKATNPGLFPSFLHLPLMPSTIAGYINHPVAQSIAGAFQPVPGCILYFIALNYLFAYFWRTAIQFDPYKMADMKKYGGFIP